MNFWFVKSEPEAYSWAQLVKDGKTAWTGVRNFAVDACKICAADGIGGNENLTDRDDLPVARGSAATPVSQR